MSRTRKMSRASGSASKRGGRGGRLKSWGVVEKAAVLEETTMPRQPDGVLVSKTVAKLGAPRRRPNLQNPNGWQSTSSNRTARTDASGRPDRTTNHQDKERMHVGIDVSKSHLDAHVHESGLAFRV